MEEIIQAVTCPFTGTADLSVPTDGIWAGRIDDGEHVVFYFDAEEVHDEGLDSCLSALMDDYHMDKVGKARQVLQDTLQIKLYRMQKGTSGILFVCQNFPINQQSLI
jgi:hypothetical protein